MWRYALYKDFIKCLFLKRLKIAHINTWGRIYKSCWFIQHGGKNGGIYNSKTCDMIDSFYILNDVQEKS